MSQITNDDIAAGEVNFKKYNYSHPTYRFRKVVASESGEQVVPTSTTISTTFEIPTGVVFNLAESYLNFSYSIPAPGAGIANQVWRDTYGMINSISLYDEMGTYLCNLNNLQNYIKVVGKKEMRVTDLLSRDKNQNNIYPCNTQDTHSVLHTGDKMHVGYLESEYLDHSTVLATATNHILKVPLSDFKNTILALDKDIFLPHKFMMTVNWGPGVKAAFRSTGVLTPQSNPIALAEDIKVNNLCLMIAVEENKGLATKIKNMVLNPGDKKFQIYIPYVTAYKIAKDKENQSISLTFTYEQGQRLQKVIHSAFNRVESKNTAYDCDNSDGKKILRYRTSINSEPRQDFDIRCETKYGDDYMYNKRFLRGSAILNSGVYQYNWFHCDDFTEYPAPGEDPCAVPTDNLNAGLPLGGPEAAANGQSITWSSDMTCKVAANDDMPLYHYVWVVGQKLLSCIGTDVTCK